MSCVYERYQAVEAMLATPGELASTPVPLLRQPHVWGCTPMCTMLALQLSTCAVPAESDMTHACALHVLLQSHSIACPQGWLGAFAPAL